MDGVQNGSQFMAQLQEAAEKAEAQFWAEVEAIEKLAAEQPDLDVNDPQFIEAVRNARNG